MRNDNNKGNVRYFDSKIEKRRAKVKERFDCDLQDEFLDDDESIFENILTAEVMRENISIKMNFLIHCLKTKFGISHVDLDYQNEKFYLQFKADKQLDSNFGFNSQEGKNQIVMSIVISEEQLLDAEPIELTNQIGQSFYLEYWKKTKSYQLILGKDSESSEQNITSEGKISEFEQNFVETKMKYIESLLKHRYGAFEIVWNLENRRVIIELLDFYCDCCSPTKSLKERRMRRYTINYGEIISCDPQIAAKSLNIIAWKLYSNR